MGPAIFIASEGLLPQADGAGAWDPCFKTSEGEVFVATVFQLFSVIFAGGAFPLSGEDEVAITAGLGILSGVFLVASVVVSVA